MEPKVYIIHENSEWTKPLLRELEKIGVPYEDWHLDKGVIHLDEEPPSGVFYNRMSASSHTRNHRYSPEYTGAVLSWLEGHGRKVLNTNRALQLEISKVAQYTSLNTCNIITPRTAAAVGRDQILQAAQSFKGSFITKHNRAGKGLGVRKFDSLSALESYINSPDFEEPIDGITLIQEYIQAPEPYITRCEFIGGKFFYAVKVDTSEGFELCPADVCQIDDLFCPTTKTPNPKFEILDDFNHSILDKYEKFLNTNEITFAGIEMITNKEGDIFTYDVNTNTNYNPEAEQKAQKFGMRAIAQHLGNELRKL